MDAVPLSESAVREVPSGGVLGQWIVSVTAMWSANTAQARHVIEVSVPLSGGECAGCFRGFEPVHDHSAPIRRRFLPNGIASARMRITSQNCSLGGGVSGVRWLTAGRAGGPRLRLTGGAMGKA